MKIAFFYHLFPGGAKRVVYEQVKYLAQKHTIDVYTIEDEKEKKDFDPGLYAKKHFSYPFSLAPTHSFLPKRIQKDWHNFVSLQKLHKQIAKDIDKKNYDLVVVHPDIYTQAPFLLQYLQTSSVYYCHEWLRIGYEEELAFKEEVSIGKKLYEQLTRQYRKHIDRQNAQHATHIVANSVFTKNHIQKAYNSDASVCYPGVDPKLFTPQKTKKQYDVFFVGGKDTINGYFFLQEILKKYPKKLTVHYLQDDKISFLSDEEVVALYNQTKLVLCLSYHEPFGIVPLEAMSCAIPVLAVAEGGYKETISDAKTGYLLPRNAAVFCKQIAQVLKKQDKAMTLGKNGRDAILKNWTWDIHTKKFEQLLQHFLS